MNRTISCVGWIFLAAVLMVEAGCGGYTPIAIDVEGGQCIARDLDRDAAYAVDELIGKKVRIVTASQVEVVGKVVSVGVRDIELAVDVEQQGVGATGMRAEAVRLEDVRTIQVHEVNTASTVGIVAIGLAGAYAFWGLMDSFRVDSR